MFLITIIFALVVSNTLGVQVEVTIKPSSTQSCPEHVVSDDKLIIDYVSVFHTDKTKKILSAAILPVSSSFGNDGIHINKNYDSHNDRLRGDVLKDDSNGEYHLIMNVRAQVIDKDNAITYFYTDKVMDWSKSTEQNLVWNPKLYYLSPFLPGTIQVKVNGRVVIDRQDNANLCYNAYAWIPHHGIYLLNKRSEWTYMFYYPHYFPQYLS